MHKNSYIDIEYQIRSILWVIESNDWDSLYEIIRLNSCNYGGIYFPIINIDKNCKFSDLERKFIYLSDPDIIILSPNLKKNMLDISSRSYSIFEWDDRDSVLNRDLNGNSSCSNYQPYEVYSGKYEINKISTYNKDFEDESLFSFLYFGGINTIEPMWHVMDDDVDYSTYGAETFLIEKLLRKGINKIEARSHLDSKNNVIPSPDLSKLNEIIDEKYLFPFGDFDAQLNLISDTHNRNRSFLQNTLIKSEYRWDQYENMKRLPAVNIFISEKIDFETALNIWNSRAIGINTYWFNNEVLVNNLDHFVKWIDSDYGGGFCSFTTNRESTISLSIENENIKLQLIDEIKKRRKKDWPAIKIQKFQLIHTSRPILRSQKVLCVKNDNTLTFHSDPQFIDDKNCNGTFTVRILDKRYKLPYIYNDYKTVSEATYYSDRSIMPKVRIDINGYIVIQQNMSDTIQIKIPTEDNILDYCLANISLERKYTTTGKYQYEIINLFGSIDNFASIYYNYDNKIFFDLFLKTTVDPKDLGWVIKNPSKMRLLNYDNMKKLLIRNNENEKEEFIKYLIENEIIEYGLFLKCKHCDYSSFYNMKDIGKEYSCNRCSKSNYILEEVELKYRLNPIIQDGIGKNNVDVPLGAINILNNKSMYNYIWYRDLNIIDGKNQRNIDIICFLDGKLYVGEAKKNNNISEKQFDFYKKLSKLNIVSGLVFATGEKEWNNGTKERINSISKKDTEIIIINKDELYSKIGI